MRKKISLMVVGLMYLLSGFFVVNAADIDSGDLEDAILDNKTLLLADLEDAYDDAYDAVVALQDDVSVNAEYQALVCLYVYDGLLDEEDLLARVELLKERVVSTSNALLERLSNAEDNYDAGLSSDATYQLSLEGIVLDNDDFLTTSGTLFDAFVDDSTNTVADQLVSLADTVDDYEDEVLLFSVKQDAVIELSTSFEELEDLKDEYFDMLGTNVTLDTLYDDVIVAAEDAFDNYFVSINSSYYNKYEYLTILDTLLIDEKEVSLNSVKLSLQEYLNPVTRFYDIEHHEVLAVNYTEVINDYYSEDAFDCDNLVDDWNIAVVDSVQDSIDDYTELLEDGIAYIDDEDLDDATFMAALSAYLDDVLVGMKEDFEDRVDEQLLGYNSLVIDQRQEFASLLETKTLYDTASDSERALLYTYLVDSLDELQELSLDTRLSYDIEFLLYVLGAENDLVNHEPYLLVSVSSSVEYLGYVYDAYITTNSDRGLDVVSDALLIPTWITTSDNIESCGAYTRDQIVALLVDYGSKVDDVDALELKFTNAIAKADILLSSSSLSDSNRCLIQLIKGSLEDYVSLYL